MNHQKNKKISLFTFGIALMLGFASCNQNAYVVLSDRVVMNTKDGMAYPVLLDSTFQVYDHIKIKKSASGTIVKNLSASNRD